MIPTEAVYAAFIKPLSEFTKMFPEPKYINTSLVGAQIDGFENIPLEEVLKDSEPIGNISTETNFHYDLGMIKENLFKSKESLNSALIITEEIKKIANGIHNDLVRYRSVNAEILKSLKKLSVGYYTLSADFSAKNKLFDFITISERIDTDYLMKMTKEFNVENVEKLVDSIRNYAQKAEERINHISGLIDKTNL